VPHHQEETSDLHRLDTNGCQLINAWSSRSLLLRNRTGEVAVVLTIERHGQGLLLFNDGQKNGRLGVVTAGYLTGSDTDDPEDPLGAWGLGVQTSYDLRLGFGIAKDGRAFGAPVNPKR
jgi:hypothetical protein